MTPPGWVPEVFAWFAVAAASFAGTMWLSQARRDHRRGFRLPIVVGDLVMVALSAWWGLVYLLILTDHEVGGLAGPTLIRPTVWVLLLLPPWMLRTRTSDDARDLRRIFLDVEANITDMTARQGATHTPEE